MGIDSVYGKPLSSSEVLSRIGMNHNTSKKIVKSMNNQSSGSSGGGLIYHAHLFSDDTSDDNKVLKPRRPTLSLKHSAFLSSLVSVGEEEERWFFSGVLNGWPGLGYNHPLEVISITYKP